MIYVVILNWNGWRDSINCMQSVLRSKGIGVRVILCDNGSSDGSRRHIAAWSRGELACEKVEHPKLQALLGGNSRHSLQRVSREEVLAGTAVPATAEVVLIENAENLGFAGGCNTGLRYAQQQADMSHTWLLNNDTLVEPDCLLRMLKRVENTKRPAICGSRVMFYDDPSIIQALGGNRFNKWTGNASTSLGRYMKESEEREASEFEAAMDYVSGCSTLLPRAFLEEIGFMDERYFLYYEEIDLARRCRGKFELVYADDAVIYHKEGSSIGSASLHTGPSLLSEYYCFRSKLRFTRKHHFLCIPSCYFTTLLQILNRWRKGKWQSGWQIMTVMFGRKTPMVKPTASSTLQVHEHS